MTPRPCDSSTDRLIAYYAERTHLSPDELGAAIPAAIDAVYASRDVGGNVHHAGAAAAVAALEAAARTAREQ